ncbi:MAG: hypothetical protein JXB30_08025, partial [Anaerolineae bacterium]|nr:hypothetical protein [Anaerolineae bacterium]
MMNSKQVISSILTVIVVLGLAACGNAPAGQIDPVQNAANAVEPTQPPEQPTVVSKLTEHPLPTSTPEQTEIEPTNPPEQPTDIPADQPEQPESAPTNEPEQPAPAPTEVVIPPTGETADAIMEAWSQAYELPAGVPFAVTFTEAQIEALIAQAMATGGYGSNVSGVDVSLNNSQIGVSFTVTLAETVGARTINISGTATVVFNAAIDGNGQLVLSVASATISTSTGQQKNIPP